MPLSLILGLVLLLALILPLMSPRYLKSFERKDSGEPEKFISKQEFYASGIRHIVNAIFIFGISLFMASVVYRVTPESSFKDVRNVMLFIGWGVILVTAILLTKGIKCIINGFYVKQRSLSPEEVMRLDREAPHPDGEESMVEFLRTFKVNKKEDIDALRILAEKRAKEIGAMSGSTGNAGADDKKVVFSKTFTFKTKKRISQEEAYRLLAEQRDAGRMGKDDKKIIFSKTFKIDVPIKKDEPPHGSA